MIGFAFFMMSCVIFSQVWCKLLADSSLCYAWGLWSCWFHSSWSRLPCSEAEWTFYQTAQPQAVATCQLPGSVNARTFGSVAGAVGLGTLGRALWWRTMARSWGNDRALSWHSGMKYFPSSFLVWLWTGSCEFGLWMLNSKYLWNVMAKTKYIH